MKISRRPALFMAAALLFGILNSYFLISNSNIYIFKIILTSALLYLFFYLLYKSNRSKKSAYIILTIIFFIIGNLLFAYQEYKYSSKYSTANFSSEKHLNVRGEIDLDIGDLESDKLYLKADFINGKKVKYGKIIINSKELSFLNNGDLISLDLKLSKPDQKLNPGAFSYFNYLKKRGVYLQGWDPKNLHLVAEQKSLKGLIIIIKRKFLKNINALFSKDKAAFIKAILLGEREKLSYEQENLLRTTGASHLLAISGLHIGIIILSFSFLLFKIFSKRIHALYLLTLFTLLYIIMVGAAVSIIRASLLALLFLWSGEFNREGDFLNIISLTLIINLLIDPLALFSVSLQLSYILVLALFYLTPLLNNLFPLFFSVSLAAQLASITISAYYFNEYAYIAILTNLWLIPLITILLPLIFITVLISLITLDLLFPFVLIIEFSLSFLFKALNLMTIIQNRTIVIAEPDMIVVILYYLSLFSFPLIFQKRKIYLLQKKYFFWQKFFLILFIIVFISLFINFNSKLLEVNFIAVGQGDGIYIEFPDGKNMLVDTGPPGSSGRNIEYNIISFLNFVGVSELDYLMISHFDADHVGGIEHLLKRKEVKNIMIPPFREESIYHKILKNELMQNKGLNLIYLQEGMYFKISDCNFYILNPALDIIEADRNENSIVFLLNHQNKNLLFTGDLSKEGEKRILNNNSLPELDVLKVGHHGSNTSSSKELLDKTAPKLAVISVGRNNHGHPSAEVIKRFERRGINYLRTDKAGMIKVLSNGKKITVKTFR